MSTKKSYEYRLREIPAGLWIEAKVIAAKKQTTLQKIILEALEIYLKKAKK